MTYKKYSKGIIVFTCGVVLGLVYSITSDLHFYKITVLPSLPSVARPLARPLPPPKLPILSIPIPTEEECLAKNIYFESGNQSKKGKEAVGLVVLNRVKNQKYPNTICDVIYQKSQFSWYWDKKSDDPNVNDPQWEISKDVAKQLILRYNLDMIDDFDATHYHADYVNPKWARKKKQIAKIGNHIFYR